jgi:hypothetical protein
MNILSFIPLIVVIILTIIGFIVKNLDYKELLLSLKFTFDYRNKLIELVEGLIKTGRVNNPLYIELTESVVKMQSELGSDGVVSMTDNLHRVHVPRYQMLVNFLPKIRSVNQGFLYSTSIGRERFSEEAQNCEDMLIRHIGKLKETAKIAERQRFNPLRCFSEGVRYIIWLPTNLLLSLGVISKKLAYTLKYNFIVKFLTALIALIGLIGSVITIILGWEQTIEFLQSLIGVI